MTQSMTACPKLKIEINTRFCKQLCNKHHNVIGCTYKTEPPEEGPNFVVGLIDFGRN
jgi:hypothetical protein